MPGEQLVEDSDDGTRLDLPADATAPAVARSHARETLRGWSVPGVLEPLVLVVSELVSNAVRHGRPPVGLLLRRVGKGVRVDVHDESSAFPSAPDMDDRVPADLDAEGGRGLPIVDAVSVDHGVDQIPDDGKNVWAVVNPEASASRD